MKPKANDTENLSLDFGFEPETFMPPVEVLHRSEDSYIGVVRKSSNGFENLFSVTPRELRSMLPELSKWLLKDAYFTVNGYYRGDGKKSDVTGLPTVWRSEKNLRYLNACYVDLDIYKADGGEGKTINEASQVLIDLMFGGTLPQCSMTARSGRGMYAFWILRDDENPNVAPRGDMRFYRERMALYKQVNEAIGEHLRALAWDEKTKDGARVLRTPGTRHGVTGAQCVYTINYDDQGGLFTYTLSELAALLGVREMATSLPDSVRNVDEIDEAFRSFEPEKTTDSERAKVPNRANARKALARDRAQDLVVLEQHRGGWQKGSRRFHLRLYAQFLKAAKCERSEALKAVSIMANNCQPKPYPSDLNDSTIDRIVGEVWSDPALKNHNNQNLIKWLKITHDEARELDLKRLIPQTLRDERATAAAPVKSNRELKTEARRKIIYDLIISSGMKSAREFVVCLATEGVKSNPQTVNQDLDALGFGDHPSRKRAGRKAAKS